MDIKTRLRTALLSLEDRDLSSQGHYSIKMIIEKLQTFQQAGVVVRGLVSGLDRCSRSAASNRIVLLSYLLVTQGHLSPVRALPQAMPSIAAYIKRQQHSTNLDDLVTLGNRLGQALAAAMSEASAFTAVHGTSLGSPREDGKHTAVRARQGDIYQQPDRPSSSPMPRGSTGVVPVVDAWLPFVADPSWVLNNVLLPLLRVACRAPEREAMAASCAVLVPLVESLGRGPVDRTVPGGGLSTRGPIAEVLQRLLGWTFSLLGGVSVPLRTAGMLQLFATCVQVLGPALDADAAKRMLLAATAGLDCTDDWQVRREAANLIRVLTWLAQLADEELEPDGGAVAFMSGPHHREFLLQALEPIRHDKFPAVRAAFQAAIAAVAQLSMPSAGEADPSDADDWPGQLSGVQAVLPVRPYRLRRGNTPHQRHAITSASMASEHSGGLVRSAASVAGARSSDYWGGNEADAATRQSDQQPTPDDDIDRQVEYQREPSLSGLTEAPLRIQSVARRTAGVWEGAGLAADARTSAAGSDAGQATAWARKGNADKTMSRVPPSAAAAVVRCSSAMERSTISNFPQLPGHRPGPPSKRSERPLEQAAVAIAIRRRSADDEVGAGSVYDEYKYSYGIDDESAMRCRGVTRERSSISMTLGESPAPVLASGCQLPVYQVTGETSSVTWDPTLPALDDDDASGDAFSFSGAFDDGNRGGGDRDDFQVEIRVHGARRSNSDGWPTHKDEEDGDYGSAVGGSDRTQGVSRARAGDPMPTSCSRYSAHEAVGPEGLGSAALHREAKWREHPPAAAPAKRPEEDDMPTLFPSKSPRVPLDDTTRIADPARLRPPPRGRPGNTAAAARELRVPLRETSPAVSGRQQQQQLARPPWRCPSRGPSPRRTRTSSSSAGEGHPVAAPEAPMLAPRCGPSPPRLASPSGARRACGSAWWISDDAGMGAGATASGRGRGPGDAEEYEGVAGPGAPGSRAPTAASRPARSTALTVRPRAAATGGMNNIRSCGDGPLAMAASPSRRFQRQDAVRVSLGWPQRYRPPRGCPRFRRPAVLPEQSDFGVLVFAKEPPPPPPPLLAVARDPLDANPLGIAEHAAGDIAESSMYKVNVRSAEEEMTAVVAIKSPRSPDHSGCSRSSHVRRTMAGEGGGTKTLCAGNDLDYRSPSFSQGRDLGRATHVRGPGNPSLAAAAAAAAVAVGAAAVAAVARASNDGDPSHPHHLAAEVRLLGGQVQDRRPDGARPSSAPGDYPVSEGRGVNAGQRMGKGEGAFWSSEDVEASTSCADGSNDYSGVRVGNRRGSAAMEHQLQALLQQAQALQASLARLGRQGHGGTRKQRRRWDNQKPVAAVVNTDSPIAAWRGAVPGTASPPQATAAAQHVDSAAVHAAVGQLQHLLKQAAGAQAGLQMLLAGAGASKTLHDAVTRLADLVNTLLQAEGGIGRATSAAAECVNTQTPSAPHVRGPSHAISGDTTALGSWPGLHEGQTGQPALAAGTDALFGAETTAALQDLIKQMEATRQSISLLAKKRLQPEAAAHVADNQGSVPHPVLHGGGTVMPSLGLAQTSNLLSAPHQVHQRPGILTGVSLADEPSQQLATLSLGAEFPSGTDLTDASLQPSAQAPLLRGVEQISLSQSPTAQLSERLGAGSGGRQPDVTQHGPHPHSMVSAFGDAVAEALQATVGSQRLPFSGSNDGMNAALPLKGMVSGRIPATIDPKRAKLDASYDGENAECGALDLEDSDADVDISGINVTSAPERGVASITAALGNLIQRTGSLHVPGVLTTSTPTARSNGKRHIRGPGPGHAPSHAEMGGSQDALTSTQAIETRLGQVGPEINDAQHLPRIIDFRPLLPLATTRPHVVDPSSSLAGLAATSRATLPRASSPSMPAAMSHLHKLEAACAPVNAVRARQHASAHQLAAAVPALARSTDSSPPRQARTVYPLAVVPRQPRYPATADDDPVANPVLEPPPQNAVPVAIDRLPLPSANTVLGPELSRLTVTTPSGAVAIGDGSLHIITAAAARAAARLAALDIADSATSQPCAPLCVEMGIQAGPQPSGLASEANRISSSSPPHRFPMSRKGYENPHGDKLTSDGGSDGGSGSALLPDNSSRPVVVASGDPLLRSEVSPIGSPMGRLRLASPGGAHTVLALSTMDNNRNQELGVLNSLHLVVKETLVLDIMALPGEKTVDVVEGVDKPGSPCSPRPLAQLGLLPPECVDPAGMRKEAGGAAVVAPRRPASPGKGLGGISAIRTTSTPQNLSHSSERAVAGERNLLMHGSHNGAQEVPSPSKALPWDPTRGSISDMVSMDSVEDVVEAHHRTSSFFPMPQAVLADADRGTQGPAASGVPWHGLEQQGQKMPFEGAGQTEWDDADDLFVYPLPTLDTESGPPGAGAADLAAMFPATAAALARRDALNLTEIRQQSARDESQGTSYASFGAMASPRSRDMPMDESAASYSPRLSDGAKDTNACPPLLPSPDPTVGVHRLSGPRLSALESLQALRDSASGLAKSSVAAVREVEDLVSRLTLLQ
ncbi:hypothetical protein VaNZ11_001025, partial [Volvox africanus]